MGDEAMIRADVLWGEHVIAWLDQYPQIWPSFPDLFAGRVVPCVGAVAGNVDSGIARSLRLALATQFRRDGLVRFRQIELEEKITRLFVDLDIALSESSGAEFEGILAELHRRERHGRHLARGSRRSNQRALPRPGRRQRLSCMQFFSCDDRSEDRRWPRKLLVEGGPGQGKSTLTQMLAQVYRSMLLNGFDEYAEFCCPERARLPFRIELRLFAEWLNASDGTVEQYLAQMLSKDAGGSPIGVGDLHDLFERSAAFIIFDGLDEVGSDELRDAVLLKISESVERLETLDRALRVLVTTRPPAIAGKTNRLPGFVRLQLLPLQTSQVDEYVEKWTTVFCADSDDRERISHSFNKRRDEVHVNALAKNPMQLSVLLQFIRLKGEAFPDRRAELYRDYFRTVIDRDVEKAPRLLGMRGDIETLHEVIGFQIHSMAESDKASSSLTRQQLITIVEDWLRSEDRQTTMARDLFKLGEERLGLIIAVAGEAGETRYGFEIQPVREYFAAAYINERASGNAHDFFQEMVRRPFWREVALFLAGLRRANEKADLLLRAKALDDDSQLGWRQDGTSTILELLQEGVLTSPGHVHRDSISFVFRLLSPTVAVPRNEPRALLRAIPNLIGNCNAEVHLDQLRTFLAEGSAVTDGGALDRLHAVAYKLLDSNCLSAYLSALSARPDVVSAEAHILSPKIDKVDLCGLSGNVEFWPTSPNSIWAAVWLKAGILQPAKTSLAASPTYHLLLTEQFTFLSLRSRRRGSEPDWEVPPASNWGIWWLRCYLKNLCVALCSRSVRPHPAVGLPEQLSYEGLDGVVSRTMGDLLQLCAAALASLTQSATDRSAITSFLRGITDHLASDGLAGWVACRCAVSLLEADLGKFRAGYAHVHTDLGDEPFSPQEAQDAGRPIFQLRRNEEWKRVRQALTPYYRRSLEFDVDAAGKSHAGRIVREGLAEICPTHVRVNGQMESVVTLLARRLRGDAVELSELLDNLVIPQSWFRELLSTDNASSGEVLREISRRSTFNGPHVALSAQVMQKILAFCRRSSEAEALSGALTCLVGSSFWSFVDNALLLKMIEADARHADVAYRLFSMYEAPHENTARLLEIAKSIVQGTVAVSRRTGIAAAAYCAQNIPVNFQPLASVFQSAF